MYLLLWICLFETFWNMEQEKAFKQLIKTENLSKERTQALMEHFLYSEKEPMRDEILELLEGDKPTILQRKTIGDRILSKIVGFVETFINGVVGG
jgi:type I restriction enzyme R subunit